jgi:hypothetical protein
LERSTRIITPAKGGCCVTLIGREIREAERIVLEEPVPSEADVPAPAEAAPLEPEETEESVPA